MDDVDVYMMEQHKHEIKAKRPLRLTVKHLDGITKVFSLLHERIQDLECDAPDNSAGGALHYIRIQRETSAAIQELEKLVEGFTNEQIKP